MKKSQKSTTSDGDKSSLSSFRKSDKKMCTFKIRQLDDSQPAMVYTLKKTDKGSVLFNKYCDNISDKSLIERDYFGLRYTDAANQRHWLELDKPVYKQLKNSKTFGLSFRVKHYPANPCTDLAQNFTKYLFYLQIRRDLLQGRLLCPEDKKCLVGALVYQAEIGDSVIEDINNFNDTTISDACSTKPEDTSFSPNMSTPIAEYNNDQSNLNDSKMSNSKYLKVFFNQDETINENIAKRHFALKGLTSEEAEYDLLETVASFPTYGVDPFLVKPQFEMVRVNASELNHSTSVQNVSKSLDASSINKSNPNISKKSEGLSEQSSVKKTTSYYIGLRHDGVVTFIGIKVNNIYPWEDLSQIYCDGSTFVLCVKGKEKKSKDKVYKFACENKQAALALWKWTLDRKCFFTLKQSKQAKTHKSTKGLLSRGKSFRFSGTPLAELRQKTPNDDKLPQPTFVRVSSLRRLKVDGTEKLGNLGRTTMPARIKPKLDGDDKPINVLDSLRISEPTLTNEPGCELNSLLKKSDDAPEVNVKEEIENTIITQTNAQPVESIRSSTSSASVTKLEIEVPEPENVPESVRKSNGSTDLNESGQSQGLLSTSAECRKAVDELDRTIKSHTTLSDTHVTNGNTVHSKVNGNAQKVVSQAQSDDDDCEALKSYLITAANLLMLVLSIILFFIIMEAKPTSGTKGHFRAIAEDIRRQPIVDAFGRNFYDPVRQYFADMVQSSTQK